MLGSFGGSFFVGELYGGVSGIGRVSIAGDLLTSDTEPGEAVNFLVIGLDSSEGLDPDDPAARAFDPRGTANADSIAIVRVDPTNARASVLSIPRDLFVDIPGAVNDDLKINAASLFGASTLVETVSSNFGIEINHFIQVDFLAFRDIVDVLGGVPLWFPNQARDNRPHRDALVIDTPGCVVLDGSTALSFVRARRYQEFVDGQWQYVGNSDFGRIERQQLFVAAALDRAVARGARNLTAMSSLIESASQSVVLDQALTPAELIDLASAFTNFSSDSLQTFSPAVVDFTTERGVQGLLLAEPLDSEVFELFRGAEPESTSVATTTVPESTTSSLPEQSTTTEPDQTTVAPTSTVTTVPPVTTTTVAVGPSQVPDGVTCSG